jgi:DNA-binding CsgD family transcriptional regulator
MGQVVPVLTRWGVSADADLVYRALRQLPPRDSGGLARELGMSIRRVQTAVEELVALGAVQPAPGALQPAAVDRVLGVLRRPRRRSAADDPGDRWRRHVAAVQELGPLAVSAVRRWPSRAAARVRVAQLAAAERHEHLAVHTEEVLTAESLSAGQPLDRSLLNRGVRMLTVERPPSDGDRGLPAHALDVPTGMGYRQTDDVPLKLMVFDRRVAFFPADPLDLEQGYVEVADPTGVQRCCALFHRLWHSGRDPMRHGVAPFELSARERALVALLADGHTDVSAATGLGLSPRAVSYAMRALMDRAGADNRFQLGLLLGATGTVRPTNLTDEEN